MCSLTFVNIVGVFTIISAIATAGYAYIAYNTLKEIKNQRETTYKPDVILEKFRFYVYSIVKNDLPYPCDWSETDNGYDFEVTNAKRYFYLKLHNIGLGAAKYITATYSFDIDATLKLIEAENNKLPDNLKFSITRNNNSFEFKPNSNTPPFGSSYFSNVLHVNTLNHILPASITKEATYLIMSHLYLEFISLTIYLMYATAKNVQSTGGEVGRMNFIDLPPLVLKLDYSDISNKAHSKTFEITFSMIVSSLKRVESEFEIKEINNA